MAEKTVTLFEARRILDRLEMEKCHLLDILGLIQKDMGNGLGYTQPYYPEEEKKADVIVAEGGEATINVGEQARQTLTPEQVEDYRARMEPIKQELEDLHTKMVGVQMILERAELDTQVTIDV